MKVPTLAKAKVCAVLGVGPGIGLSVAKRFASENFTVAVLARDTKRLKQRVTVIEEAGGTVKAFAIDCAEPANIRDALRVVTEDLGPPSVLVYNAAATRPGLPSSLPAARLLDELKINVVGALAATQAVLPAMIDAGAGTILFTGGGLALEPWPEMASLAVGKAGIRSLALSLAKELREKSVHVATITVCGVVAKGGAFDPDQIADAYWRLHQQARADWEHEVVIR